MRKKIDDLNVGDKIIGQEGASIVRQCVHGNKYYAHEGEIGEVINGEELTTKNRIAVYDDDVDHIPCCG